MKKILTLIINLFILSVLSQEKDCQLDIYIVINQKADVNKLTSTNDSILVEEYSLLWPSKTFNKKLSLGLDDNCKLIKDGILPTYRSFNGLILNYKNINNNNPPTLIQEKTKYNELLKKQIDNSFKELNVVYFDDFEYYSYEELIAFFYKATNIYLLFLDEKIENYYIIKRVETSKTN